MSDVTVLPTGGTSGGGTNWLLIGGAGVAVVLVLLMLTRKSAAGQPTVAAGTSINAALGSIQEQNLNVMGEISQNDQALTNELSTVGGNVLAGNQQTLGAIDTLGQGISQGLDFYSKQNQQLSADSLSQLSQYDQQLIADILGHPYNYYQPQA